MVFLIASIFYISFHLFLRAYQIGVRRRLDLVKDWNNIQLPNPEIHRITFICLYIVSGVIFILTTVILLIFKVPLMNWWPLGFVGFFSAHYLNYISKRARGEINLEKPNDGLVRLSGCHIAVLVIFLLFSLAILLAGGLLLVADKGESVWKLLLCGGVGVMLSFKVISIKYVKK